MKERDVMLMPVRSEDVPLVAKWTEEWLGTAHPLAYSLTIFSSPGYTDFLQNQLKSEQKTAGSTHLIGAYDGGQMLGFIELRQAPDQLFINNFCVKKEARGRQIGERLLQYTEQLAKSVGASTVGLDCFVWNGRALDKYAESGFRETSRVHWYTRQNEWGSQTPVEFEIKNGQEADAHQHAFGFSRLHVQTEKGVMAVNRLKDSYFRLSIHEKNPEYFNILSQLDQSRTLFLIGSEEAAEKGWNKASESVRFEKKIG
ncbi:GNAT family N-acetyltransferase [Domibacillus sp. DTU_2020_1001157_1_SI_ALB_TIR_016]|uniref:GNAT family N-acetyltransferase n=1 Tax=Domibacillus sp. DTU_2020_1001157_1_SI_ALB_TIR_016 TaxID=3077789 RepID=UPI0028ED4119|nr:GNAT family N-acetyltransferase [Domibacillus sp. DTU_2020_1001157_1_SI_ALB_TIR_016]WNS81215.1 GNAT family N-acetyltransferase [Domibacillus sp. DTU_2020_1001157_1_SI_ALB_TIR_016]